MIKNLSIIAAVARNNALGYKNELLYRLPNDMKFFKEKTTGHTVIMGLNTYYSLPHGALPNRRNIVLSFEPVTCEGCEVYLSLEEALNHCAGDDEVFVMGGASVYRQAFALAHKLYLTCVEDVPPLADVFFPLVDEKEWEEKSSDARQPDEKHRYSYTFKEYVRREL